MADENASEATTTQHAEIIFASSLFKGADADTVQQLEQILLSLVGLRMRAASLGKQLGQRRLVQLADILNALGGATFLDGAGEKALNGPHAWARQRLARGIATGARARTAQEEARRLRDDVRALAEQRKTRREVAEYLAAEVAAYVGIPPEDAPVADVSRRLPTGLDNDPFDGESATASVIAAFKACGYPRHRADKLFARETQERARAVSKRQNAAKSKAR